jgi:hypothetical protein
VRADTHDLEDYEAAKAADPSFIELLDSTGAWDAPIDEANIKIKMAELKDKCFCFSTMLLSHNSFRVVCFHTDCWPQYSLSIVC